MILREQLISDPNWFGGRVYGFGKTEEGFLLCIEGSVDQTGQIFPANEVIGIYIPTLEGISDVGIALLKQSGYLDDEPIISQEVKPVEDAIEETEEKPQNVITHQAEVTSKINALVNERLANRSRRVTNPI